jgi:ABC-type branched-subunit amino acid transport system substrate-binding protein
VEFFKNAVVANRNDPEVLIYYNNARARQQGSPLTLAVVVPVDNSGSTAQEMLRGVAQAQNQFNAEGGLNGRLLEIAIANDGNIPQQAQKVAQELVKDPSVLGVIGHNSSEDTKAALPEYEQANLAIVSPTSSSTYLNSKVFFRTVPSNAEFGEQLAEYLRKLSITKVVIFYNPDSLYSNSMREEFTNNFTTIGGQVVRKPIDMTSPTLNVDEEIKASVSAQAQAALLFPDVNRYRGALNIASSNAKLPQAQRLKLLGGSGLYGDKTLKQGGKDVEGLIIPVPWFREAPQSKHFAQVAAKQWLGEVGWSTASSFDATQAFINALSLSSNPSRKTVLQKLPQVNLSASQTSGEPLKFTPNGERQSQLILVKVEGGKFVIVH